MSKVDDVISLATPEAALRELKRAKEFWQSIKDLPLVDDIENSGVDWDALEAKLEATGLKLPFVYPKAARQADGQRVMTMEAAMQILQTWETQMVRAFVISPTKIGLGLIGGTETMILSGPLRSLKFSKPSSIRTGTKPRLIGKPSWNLSKMESPRFCWDPNLT